MKNMKPIFPTHLHLVRLASYGLGEGWVFGRVLPVSFRQGDTRRVIETAKATSTSISRDSLNQAQGDNTENAKDPPPSLSLSMILARPLSSAEFAIPLPPAIMRILLG